MTDEPQVPRSSRLLWTLAGIACLVFVFSIAREVLPAGLLGGEEESLTDLRDRLDRERTELRRDYQTELDEWNSKNEALRREIAELEGSETP